MFQKIKNINSSRFLISVTSLSAPSLSVSPLSVSPLSVSPLSVSPHKTVCFHGECSSKNELPYIAKSSASLLVRTVLLISTVLIVVLFISCQNQNIKPSRHLFDLNIGGLPGEIIFWDKHINKKIQNAFAMKNEVFYIGNGERIMSISSSGYLLDYIANDPVLFKESQSNATKEEYFDATVPFFYYPFNYVKHITADSEGKIITSNTRSDKTSKTEFFRVDMSFYKDDILVYDGNDVQSVLSQNNDFNDFGANIGLATQSNGNIISINKLESDYAVYVIDKGNRILRKINFPEGQFPEYFLNDAEKNLNAGSKNNILGLIKNIEPSYKQNYLYIQYDYYSQIFDEYDGTMIQLDYIGTRVYRMNIDTGILESYISVPKLLFQVNLELKKVLQNEDLLFFNYSKKSTQTVEEEKSLSNLQITILSQSGKIKEQNILQLPQEDFSDFNFAFDEQGNVAAYFLHRDKMSVYWWNK